MRTSTSFLAGAGTVIVAMAAWGWAADSMMGNIMSPHETRTISKVEQRNATGPQQAQQSPQPASDQSGAAHHYGRGRTADAESLSRGDPAGRDRAGRRLSRARKSAAGWNEPRSYQTRAADGQQDRIERPARETEARRSFGDFTAGYGTGHA